VSEIGEDKASALKELATVGEDLEALIISIDKRSRKIGLSLRDLKDALEKKDMDDFMDVEKESSNATLADLIKTDNAVSAEEETSAPEETALSEEVQAPEAEESPEEEKE